MGGVSSSSNGQSVFSLDSQSGVMQLLAAIRSSDLSAADKNEIRDLVFLYTNGGHDESVKIALEQKLSLHNIQPIEKKAAPKAKTETERPTIGTYRAAPTFAVSPISDTVPKETIQAEPPKVVDESVSAAVPEPAVVPKVEPRVVPKQVEQTKPQEPPVTPEPASQPPVSVPPIDADANLNRIKEIKSLVNEKVGNPVQLIDTNPEVGREYMSALLDAMKKVNSGSSAVSAMQRLEAAYSAIDQIDKVAVSPQSKQPEPANAIPMSDLGAAAKKLESLQEELSQPEPVTPIQQKPIAPPPVASVPLQPPTPKPAPIEPIVDTPAYQPASVLQPQNKVPVSQMGRPQTAPTELPISSTPRTAFATDGHDESRSTTPQVLPKGEPVAPNPPPISPVDTLSSPLIKGTPQQTNSTGGDLLRNEEVENGLDQLLSEWPIFKKSGIFGTGPKGKEHPLFKKVANLQIPLLLAGRFEGATQEIKQSITDYMNGWRYEQGIIYEQGETFEHYLRRVIRHIIDLQKNRM